MSSNESNPPSTSAPSQSSGTPTYTMAAAINLPTFPEFELQPRDTAPTRFEEYVKRLNMFTAMNITQAPRKTTVNILSKKDCDGLKEKPKLLKTNVKVYPYMSSKPLHLCGKLRVSVASDHLSSEETFYVAEGSSGSILSWITSQKIESRQSCKHS